jgi:hypothetical protein
MKYSLPTGEVVDIDIDDILEIDFTTTKGKQVMQEIIHLREKVKHYKDFDDAIDNDSLKFLDITKADMEELEEELNEFNDKEINSLEDYERDLFYSSIKEKLGEE